MTDNSTLKGKRIGSRSRRKPSTYEEGRVCAQQDCSTELSRYNRRQFCFQHAPTRFPRIRGRQPKRPKKAS